MARPEFDYRDFIKRTPIVFMDTETTGIDPKRHLILTFGAVSYLNGHTFNPLYLRIKYNSYENRVDPNALKKNKINIEEHHYHPDAVTWQEANEIINIYVRSLRCGKVRAGGHNYLGFDINFISKLQRNYSDLFMGFTADTQQIAQSLVEAGKLDVPRVNLEYLAKHFDLMHKDAHNALDDVLATSELYSKLIEVMRG